MTEVELIQKLESVLDTLRPADQRFAQSMLDQWKKRGSLSEKQWFWVRKFAGVEKQADKDFQKHVAKNSRNVGGMQALIEMLRHAKQHLKYPKLFLETAPYAVELTCNHCGYKLPLMQRRDGETVQQLLDRMPNVPCPSGDGGIMMARPVGHPVRVALAGPRSRYEGQIMVTDGGPYGENVWYGRIDETGSWFVPKNAQGLHEIAEVEALLRKMANDPTGTAEAHGRLHGNCCFCGNVLSDPNSTDLGYGPTCAKNYGLKWGRKNAA